MVLRGHCGVWVLPHSALAAGLLHLLEEAFLPQRRGRWAVLPSDGSVFAKSAIASSAEFISGG